MRPLVTKEERLEAERLAYIAVRVLPLDNNEFDVTDAHSDWRFEWKRFIEGYAAACESKRARSQKLRNVLGMLDHVGMIEPYDRIVREAIAEYEASK